MISKQYRYEMHLHTKEFGWCAHVWAKDIVDTYVREGYDGICVTNHYFSEGMDSLPGVTWEEKVESWLDGYKAATKQAEKYPGFDVILGVEIRIDEGYEDFLIYGVTRDLLVSNPQIFHYKLKELFDFCDRNNLLLYQAHPFRKWLNLRDTKYLHGLEVYNGNPRHDSHNERALEVAQQYNMLMIAGSDYHEIGDEASAAMVFDFKINDSRQMADALRRGSGKIWKV